MLLPVRVNFEFFYFIFILDPFESAYKYTIRAILVIILFFHLQSYVSKILTRTFPTILVSFPGGKGVEK